MPPKNTITWLTDWVEQEQNKKHSLAVRYIEENVDLIDIDLQKFIDACPSSCQIQVYEMLVEAGIDMTSCVLNDTIKLYSSYIKYTHEYRADEYMKATQMWQPAWTIETVVSDLDSAVYTKA